MLCPIYMFLLRAAPRKYQLDVETVKKMTWPQT